MTIVRKKITPDYFELIKSGKKKFELRVADFDIQKRDTLILEEWNPDTKEYTGRVIKRKAGFVLRFPLDKFGQKDLIEKHGLYVIQLED